jgi:hypothetical protein
MLPLTVGLIYAPGSMLRFVGPNAVIQDIYILSTNNAHRRILKPGQQA